MKNTTTQADPPVTSPTVGAKSSPDFTITHHGTVSLFHPFTEAARVWLRLNCPHDGEHSYLGHALAIEHRFVSHILALAIDDGLKPATQGRN